MPRPWHRGRVVLLGDACHATTPHLASGAGMAVESAIVLVAEVLKSGRSTVEGLAAYEERRFERCQFIIDTSVGVGRMQLAGAGPEQVGAMLGAGLHRLAEPF
jgi:2-polyprenyl-6-methoxyphenol hydroxylase-like FAD-dependent oxidoreductase